MHTPSATLHFGKRATGFWSFFFSGLTGVATWIIVAMLLLIL